MIRKPIQYVSCNAESKCGIIVAVWKEDDAVKRKSFSFHVCGRSHDEAYALAKEHLKEKGVLWISNG